MPGNTVRGLGPTGEPWLAGDRGSGDDTAGKGCVAPAADVLVWVSAAPVGVGVCDDVTNCCNIRDRFPDVDTARVLVIT